MRVDTRRLSFLAIISLSMMFGMPVLAGPMVADWHNKNVLQQLVDGEPIPSLITDLPSNDRDKIVEEANIQAMIAQWGRSLRQKNILAEVSSNTWWPIADDMQIEDNWMLAVDDGVSFVKLAIAQMDNVTSEDYIAIWGVQHNQVGQLENQNVDQQPVWTDGSSLDEFRLFASLQIAQRS